MRCQNGQFNLRVVFLTIMRSKLSSKIVTFAIFISFTLTSLSGWTMNKFTINRISNATLFSKIEMASLFQCGALCMKKYCTHQCEGMAIIDNFCYLFTNVKILRENEVKIGTIMILDQVDPSVGFDCYFDYYTKK